ncbi:hypothetical protein SAMN05444166_0244 [Singulisphaera sp. GP187]|uniref:hypothetical protein n=1 Tax=Singulisphaera sp. GP187 TaxID=1882752 RepID=UPI000925BEFF|nr:hypothetical protein [Singulisphaera sp. GP187]SIN70215.1 hypothetical protein SAMN05444166_0244 [Singulisphaera sp. GP187]
MSKPRTASAATFAPPLSHRTLLRATSTIAAIGGIATSHPAASPRRNAQRSRLVSAVNRYHAAAVDFSSAQPCSDDDFDAVTKEFFAARSAVVNAVRTVQGRPKPSPLGSLVEETAPQAVVVQGMLVVVIETTEQEDGPTVHLVPLTEIADVV